MRLANIVERYAVAREKAAMANLQVRARDSPPSSAAASKLTNTFLFMR